MLHSSHYYACYYALLWFLYQQQEVASMTIIIDGATTNEWATRDEYQRLINSNPAGLGASGAGGGNGKQQQDELILMSDGPQRQQQPLQTNGDGGEIDYDNHQRDGSSLAQSAEEAFVSRLVERDSSPKKYCGNKLIDTLELICHGRYFGGNSGPIIVEPTIKEKRFISYEKRQLPADDDSLLLMGEEDGGQFQPQQQQQKPVYRRRKSRTLDSDVIVVENANSNNPTTRSGINKRIKQRQLYDGQGDGIITGNENGENNNDDSNHNILNDNDQYFLTSAISSPVISSPSVSSRASSSSSSFLPDENTNNNQPQQHKQANLNSITNTKLLNANHYHQQQQQPQPQKINNQRLNNQNLRARHRLSRRLANQPQGPHRMCCLKPCTLEEMRNYCES